VVQFPRAIASLAAARFIQPDTIVPDPGDPQSLNRYAYTRNNPVRYTDPSGHYIIEIVDPPINEILFPPLNPPREIPYGPVLLPPNHPSNPENQGLLLSPSSARDWGIAMKAPSIVPDEGTQTYSFPVVTGGSVIYLSFAPLQVNVASNGDVLVTCSLEGGVMLSGGASAVLAKQHWNTEDVESLLGWYGVIGGSGGEGAVFGLEYSALPDGKVSALQESMGGGAGLPAELHFGFGYTWPYSPKFNIYDLY